MELVITVLVLGILAAVAAPKFADALHRHRARESALCIAGHLAAARHRARIRGQSVTVTFNVSANCYTLLGMPNPDHNSLPYVVNLSTGPLPAKLTSVNFGGAASVTFNGYGLPDRGGSVTLTSGNAIRTVVLDASTGGASVP